MDSSQQAAQLWSLEELAILETAGSGLAARSFWEQLRVAGSSWAAPSLGVALELFGVARSCSDWSVRSTENGEYQASCDFQEAWYSLFEAQKQL